MQERAFLDRYALKDSGGRPQERTPKDMWRRVARAIATVESTPELRRVWSERFDAVLRDFRFVPGGCILSGAGSGHEVTIFNCFVLRAMASCRARGCSREPPTEPRRRSAPLS